MRMVEATSDAWTVAEADADGDAEDPDVSAAALHHPGSSPRSNGRFDR